MDIKKWFGRRPDQGTQASQLEGESQPLALEEESPYRNDSTLGDDLGKLQNYRGSEDKNVEPLTEDEDTQPMAPVDPRTGRPLEDN